MCVTWLSLETSLGQQTNNRLRASLNAHQLATNDKSYFALPSSSII